MKQNRVPRNEYIIQPKGKTNPYKHDVIYSDLGQWKYPGQVTRIPSNQITMQGVPYPVQGVDDTGYSQMMYPGMDYQFPGQYVTEYPQMQIGGLIKKGLTAAKKVVKNTYKVNPWAEKLKNPNSSYRVAGLDAYDDFKNTGILRSATPNIPEGASLKMRAMYRPTSFPSFQKGYADLRYLPDEGGVIFKTDLPTFKRGDINPVTGFPIKGRHYAHRVIDPKTGAAINDIPASNIEVYNSDPHWLKGFMGIPKEAYGGDPSLTNIEGHYPFGGQNTKTHTHMKSGGSLNRKVTCSSCGWSWKLVDGGTDPMTCHKCGGTIKMQNGGWLDEMQDGGDNGIDMSKVRMDFHPKSQIEAQEQLDYEKNYELEWKKQQAENKKKNIAAAVKMGVPKKQAEAIELSQENPRDQGEIRQHIPQTNLSKAVEIAANPGLALKNYRGGRLPDYFSSNQEVDMVDPLNVINMGYQFLTPMGRTAWALQSADNVDDDIKAGDYTGAAIDAAFALPGLREGKKFAQTLNKLNRVKNINNIRKAKNAFTFNPEVLKAQQQGLQKAKKIISHPTGKMKELPSKANIKNINNDKLNFRDFQNNDAVRVMKNKIAKQKADTYDIIRNLRVEKPKLNKYLSGEKTLSKEEIEFRSKYHPIESAGYYEKPIDPNYLYNFQTYKQSPFEERFKNYKKEDGGWLDDEYRRGGQKRKRYTSKNIQSSVNDLFRRNETLFGPAGRKNYKPGLKYKDGGGWLDNLH